MKNIEEESDEDISESIEMTKDHNKSIKDLSDAPSKKTRKESLSSHESKKTKSKYIKKIFESNENGE